MNALAKAMEVHKVHKVAITQYDDSTSADGADISNEESTNDESSTTESSQTTSPEARVIAEAVTLAADAVAKRKCQLDMTVVDHGAGSTIGCIFLPLGPKRQKICIPMYPTYSVVAGTTTLPGDWLELTVHQSPWFPETSKRIRKVCNADKDIDVLKKLINDMNDSIAEARDLDKNTDRSGDDIASRHLLLRRPMLDVVVDGITIRVLNYLKKIVVQNNESTAQLVQQRLLEYCDTTAETVGSAPSSSDGGTCTTGADSVQTFGYNRTNRNAFGARLIPHVIWWCPQAFRWALWIQKTRSESEMPKFDQFAVDGSLDGTKFNAEYERQFVLAAKLWNDLDQSKRDRIQLSADA